MDIANLQAFVAIAEASSFSGAAEHLHLTQPAISKRIATLEDTLGARLFDRIGRSVTLTEAGRTLLPRAGRILLELADSRRAISNLAGEVLGTLKVATSHHIGLHHLPPALRAFSNRYAQVKLDLGFMDSEAACRLVVNGEKELGIVTLPPEPDASLETLPLWPDPLRVVAAADHPLVKKKNPRLQDLAAYPAILPAENTYTRQIFEREFAPHGLELQVGLSTNYLQTIKMLVSVGLGWSVLPKSLVDEHLRELPFKQLHIERTLGAVWHHKRTLSNAARRLLEVLQETD